MTNIKRYLILFCLGILCGLFYAKNNTPSLLVPITSSPAGQIDKKLLTVKNCSPAGEFHGETWLGNDLTEALKTIYPKARQIYQNDTVSQESYINIYLRGYLQYKPPYPDTRHINIAYVIYPLYFRHYDVNKIKQRHRLKPLDLGHANVMFDEMQFYDALAVGSISYAKKMRKNGFKAYYVPQFTNPQRFYPEYDDTIKSEILFVGGRPQSRPSVQAALKAGLPITIYGTESNGLALKEYIHNDELHRYYSSAKIVLNDHRPEMRENGFISNRIFDATASGTLVISDYMPEIEAIYGDTVPMWKTEAELIELIKYYLSPEHEAERQDKANRARQITLKNFTSDIIAQKFKQIIKNIAHNR